MLIAHIDRYVALRQTLGFTLREVARTLRAFAQFAAAAGDTHVRGATALAWAARGSSPHVRHVRFRDVMRLARFLHAEDPAHEVLIYAPAELAQLVAAAGRLRLTYPLRRPVYGTLLGLLAATGLRVSEALDLRFRDVRPDGVLQIRRTKFGKSRLVPLHPTARAALGRYLGVRGRLAVPDDHVFLSAGNRRIAASTVNATFRQVLRLAGIAPGRPRPPRLHDMRHTFATRALERRTWATRTSPTPTGTWRPRRSC